LLTCQDAECYILGRGRKRNDHISTIAGDPYPMSSDE